MKTIKLFTIVGLFITGSFLGYAKQVTSNTIKPIPKKKEIKEIPKPLMNLSSSKLVFKPVEKMCKPLDLEKTEQILKQKIGLSLNILLDKEYSAMSIMGKRITLDIGSYKVSKVANDWTYYLNDINSRMVRIDYKNGVYQLLIEFEEDNTELKGICHGCRIGNKDNRAPDIHWDNPAIRVNLEPIAYQNSLILNPTSVRLLGDFEMNGALGAFFPSITAYFKSKVERILKEKIENVFDTQEVKNLISSALQPEVAALKIGAVKKVDLSSSQLYLCNY